MTNADSPGVPSKGDVLIAPDSHYPSMYTVSIVPGPPQLRYRTYDEALAPWRLARTQGMVVWFTPDGKSFAKLNLDQPSPLPGRSQDL